jgi:cytochrome c-type biogenesis protein CcmH/NrfF
MTIRSQDRSSRRTFLTFALLLGLAWGGGLVLAPAAYAEDQPPADLKEAAQQHVDSPGASEEIAAAPAVAQRLFRDLVCLCGGCKRETLDKCPCAYAKAERDKVMGMLAGKDISTDEKADKAYTEVRDALVAEYGGQQILTVPIDKGFNKLAWIVPWVVFALALTLVVVVGQRWVARGRLATASARTRSAAATDSARRPALADEEREDRLDDELRDID